MIKVNTEALLTQRGKLEQLLRQLQQAAEDVNTVNQRLRWDVAVSKQVRQVLSQQSQNLLLLNDKAKVLHQAMTAAIEQYERTERMNSGQENSGSDSRGGGGFRGKDETEYTKIWNDFLELIKTWLDSIGDLAEIPGLGFIGSIIGVLNALIGLQNIGDSTYLDIVHKLCDLAKEGTGAVEKIYELMEELLGEKLGDKVSFCGIVSGFLGVGSEVAKIEDLSFVEKLQQSKELLESCGEFASSFYKAITTGEIASAVVRRWTAAIEGLSVAGIRMVGDVVSYSEDGSLTWSEAGTAGLNGSTSGLASLVKMWSCGVLDIDSEQAIASYTERANQVGRIIGEITDNKVEQFLLSMTGGAALSFVLGTADIAKDTAATMLNKLSNMYKIVVGSGVSPAHNGGGAW